MAAPEDTHSTLDRPLRAVVTGASSGIGHATAIELARFTNSLAEPSHSATTATSHRIVIHYRANRVGAETAARQVELLGVEAMLVQADLTIDDDRKRLVDEAWEFLDGPNTWINNAGADVLTGETAAQSFDAKLRVLLETDVIGTIQLSRDVIERWRHSRDHQKRTKNLQQAPVGPDPLGPLDQSEVNRECMVFIGWDQADRGMEGDAGQMFGPVKAAVMAFAQSLAQEVAPAIRVNTVAPGWIRTAWGEKTDTYWDRRARSQSLMERWGMPEDVARAVCFAADPRNSFLTGQTIPVNGGWNRKFPKDDTR